MEDNQRTIAREGDLSGIGLHGGKASRVYFRPARVDHGILFLKNGADVGVVGSDRLQSIPDGVSRCSAISDGVQRILTVEHLLAAVYGLGISNLVVDVHGDEIPAADGSALPFIEFIKKLGMVDQKVKKAIYRVSEPIFCAESGKAIAVYPSESFEISYCLDYDFPYLRGQKAEFVICAGIFESQIAPARTFCTADEVRELKARGFGLGGAWDNNIVVSPDGSHLEELRFPDEFVRHKILDVVGDLSLLGFPIIGKVHGIRSGHSLNRELVKAIRRQKESHGK